MKKIVLVLSVMIACMVNANAQGSYRGFVDVGPSFGHGVSLDITTAHGYQFNQNWFAGIGTGLVNILNTHIHDGDGKNSTTRTEMLSIPLFVKLRFDILSEKALTWFADANIGYAIFPYSDFEAEPVYASTMIGLRRRLTERFGLNFGIGVSLVPSTFEESYNYKYTKESAIKFNIKVGIDF